METRLAWEKRVMDQETKNRTTVERLLKDENTRRVRFRPEPEAPKETWGITVEIPRVLIELSEQQLAKLGPEPPRLEPADPTMATRP